MAHGFLPKSQGVVRHRIFENCEGKTSLLNELNLASIKEVSPFNMAAEDGEYAFYKNLKEDVEIVDGIVKTITERSRESIERHFVDKLEDVVLDDVFCINYTMEHADSRVQRHKDPSDITVNINLERSEDMEGSQVLFYGTKRLKGVEVGEENVKVEEGEENVKVEEGEEERFKVDTKLGCVTIHRGDHPHEVTSLEKGERTNIVMTFVYADKSKSSANFSGLYE